MSILISSAGRRVGLVRTFQEQLKALVPEARVFSGDQYPDLSSACAISDESIVLPAAEDLGFIDTVLEQCSANGIRLLIPTIDTELEVYSANRDHLADAGVVVVVSDTNLVRETGDKRRTSELFRNLDFRWPKRFDSVASAHLPVFIKHHSGSSALGAEVITSTVNVRGRDFDPEVFMIEEYLNPLDWEEYTVDLYYDRNSTLKCLVPRLRIATRAGEISKGITRRHHVYDFVLERMKELAGARGCITLQLFASRSSGEFRGIEINPRFGGGYPLSYRAGANYPEWLIREYLLDESVPFFDSWEPDLLMLRYDEAVYRHAP